MRGVMVGSAIAGLSGRGAVPDVPCPRYLLEIGARGGVHAVVLRADLGASLRQLRAHAVRGRRDAERPAQPAAHTSRDRSGADRVRGGASLSASEAGRMFGPDGVDWAKGAGVFLWPSVLVTIAAIRRWEANGTLRTPPTRSSTTSDTTRAKHSFECTSRLQVQDRPANPVKARLQTLESRRTLRSNCLALFDRFTRISTFRDVSISLTCLRVRVTNCAGLDAQSNSNRNS